MSVTKGRHRSYPNLRCCRNVADATRTAAGGWSKMSDEPLVRERAMRDGGEPLDRPAQIAERKYCRPQA
jgi:hypothetical protein